MVKNTVLDKVIFHVSYKCFVVRSGSQGNFIENFTATDFAETQLLEHLNTRNIIQSDFGLELFYSQLLYTCVFLMTSFLNDAVCSLCNFPHHI